MHSVTHFMDRKTITALAVSLLVSLTASADDLDVYTSQLSGQIKPNILLVLDYSGSMAKDVDGNSASSTAEKKITILKEAVDALIVKHEGRINLGLGSLYDSKPSGVRWPIAELTADPNTVDPDIPPYSYTMRDIINSQLDQRDAGGSTNTVGALADAALYFQGGPVTHNDASLTNAWDHKPDFWDDSKQEYRDGNHYSALPVSYLPQDAYVFLGEGSDGSLISSCRDYSYYDVLETNYCDGKIVNSCDLVEPYSYETDHDDDKKTPKITVNQKGYNRCEYSTNESWSQPEYVSPIAHQCQKNFMILISDGLPTKRTTGATLDSVLGADNSTCEDLSSSIFGDSDQTNGNCGPEILHKLATEDQIASIPDSKVTTYTIGFSIAGSGKAYLEKLAAAGEGKYYQANDGDELSEALGLLLDDILKGSENFAELSIDLDKASFSHDNRAYFSLFNPSTRAAWDGNVKGYFLTQDGLVDINNNQAIFTDAAGTRFDDNAQSFWSSSADGNEVILGGASEQMIEGGRELYTFTGSTIDGFTGEDLTAGANKLDKGNSLVTDAMLNNPSDRDAVLEWLKNAPMGDPLHSKVVSVNYENKKVVYAITNQGFLHAIDADKPIDPNASEEKGGEEIFAFMPPELLANLPAIHQNTSDLNGHIYGLDGQITPIHNDANDNGLVDDGESMTLVFGMRRGGNNYYAVDVTDYNKPRLMWRIQGGVAPFDNLAQTWSRMSLVTVSAESTPNAVVSAKTGVPSKQVLVFAGGYDAAVVDGTDGYVPANGNAIYMIDLDGTLIWSTTGAGTTGMDYSIPSDLTVIDIDADKIADRMYVGDTGSQVWRVDFGNVDSSAGFTVTPFADVKNTSNQPFFYAPSLAMNRSSAGDYLSVSLASGNRTNPLQADSQHAIYMLQDDDIEKGAAAGPPATITENELYKATANDVASSDPDVANAAQSSLAAKQGWYVELNTGEKGLSSLLSFDGNLMATTYEPSTATGDDVCNFVSTGKLYIMDLADGRPVKYLADGSSITEGLTAADRVTPLNGSGIPSSPVIIFPKGSSQVQIFVDKESISAVTQRLDTVFWYGQ